MDKTWIIVTDVEFQQYIPAGGALKLTFRSDADTEELLASIALQIRPNKITKMYLAVHGISADSKGSSMGMSMEGDYSLPEKIGGFGLMMGKNPIALDNDHLLQAWRGCGLKTIVMLSCAIVNGDGKGWWGDGRTLCQHLSNYTGATVYASDTIQTMTMGWSGNIYKFKPNHYDGGLLLSKPYPAEIQRVDRDSSP